MRLRDISTQASFNTSTSLLLQQFIIPALSHSTSYDRGVGYFTSNWLKLAASGLVALAANGGRARIIASPKLAAEDCAALVEGDKAKGDPALFNALQLTIDELETNLESNTLDALSWLIADGLLDFRLAVPAGELDGDFHDKFGIFSDQTDSVAFRGSPNDSERAFRNYESISAYYSWLDDREAKRVENEQARFNSIWRNEDVNLRIYELPHAIRKNLIQFSKRSQRPYSMPSSSTPNENRWQHQKEAISAFLANRRGVLEMATGTGKTRTAITILKELNERDLVTSAVISAYGTDLLDQWYSELVRNTSYPIYRDYERHKEALSFLNAPDDAVLLMSRQGLPKILPKLPLSNKKRTILIFDEVHGMGAPAMVAGLSGKLEDFEFRLGLSATPERAYDAAGNRFVDAEVGPVIYRFALEDAIKRGILCEFDYVPLEYVFSDEDKANVRLAIRRHHARASSPDPTPIELLFQELARIRKLSVEKLEPFQRFVNDNPMSLQRCLIFVETAEYGELVQHILMERGVDYHTYYGDDDRSNLKLFAAAGLECLITCKRISEGIDIRSVNNIVLFASARARLETVQRLGRCLRADPSNPSKRAQVIDFIRTDDLEPDEIDEESTADEERRDWFMRLAAVRREGEDLKSERHGGGERL